MFLGSGKLLNNPKYIPTLIFMTKYVSLSSLLAGISYPILMITVFNVSATSMIIFSILVAVLIVLTHQKNIERLLHNEENKADLSKIVVKSEKYDDN